MLFKRNLPKHINYIYGYRTKNAMKSQEHWHFAQKKQLKNSFVPDCGYV
ncbi:SdpI family protein [Myroides indicus]